MRVAQLHNDSWLGALIGDALPEAVRFGPRDPLSFEDIDLALVATYPRKLDPAIAPRLGMVNVHCSLLPLYRGPCPEFWAYVDGVAESGVTLHEVDERFDAGPIVAQWRVERSEGDSFAAFVERLYTRAVALVLETLDRYRDGRPPALPQVGPSTWAPMVRAEHLVATGDAATDARIASAAPFFQGA